MRILFGAGDFPGSNIMVSRFIQNAPDHEIRVAAFYRNHKYLHSIDWCLDALRYTKVGDSNYFKEKHGQSGPYVNHEMANLIIDDLLEWQPELVISDCEYFTAMVAKALEIPLWYCSPMLQMTGIEHDRKEINTKIFDTIKLYINSLPQGERYLIYSPLCDIICRPFLKRGFEWIRPYSVIGSETTSIELPIIQRVLPKNAVLTTGETSFISDCLYTGRSIFITPDPRDVEPVLNAQLMEWYGVAKNLGRSQNINFLKQQVEKHNTPPVLSIQNWKQLDERLEEYAR